MKLASPETKDRLIVALDFACGEDALRVVDQLGDQVSFYKVGLELLAGGAAPMLIEELQQRSKRIFADFKLHDIPNTVRSAALRVAERGVDLLTVHAQGQCVAAAVEGVEGRCNIVGVTVLTSEDGYSASIARTVRRRTEECLAQGAAGVVCSAHELGDLADLDGIRVCPGIRLDDKSGDDQARIATPELALSAGATYLVVGRPVTKAADVSAAAELIQQRIRRAQLK